MLPAILLAVLLGVPAAESTTEPPADLNFAFWNLENLFDTVDDPTNPGDDEFLPDRGWDPERYERKLEHLAGVVAELDPALLGVCEIENQAVLDALLRDSRLAKKGYKIAHLDTPDKRGIDMAVIYRAPFIMAEGPRALTLHRIDLGEGSAPTRGILEVNFNVGGHPLVVLVNHWPSRRGGLERSAPHRRAAAETARRVITARIDAAALEGREADILLIGDLNDDPHDASVIEHLDAVRGRFALRGDRGRYRLFNPSWKFLGTPDRGTLYYSAGWNVFDQVIVSRGMLDTKGFQYVDGSLEIHDPEKIRNTSHPAHPPRWFRKYKGNWDEGYSDHFAVHGRLRVSLPSQE